MTMNQCFILRKLISQGFYNKALPKSNLKSGSSPANYTPSCPNPRGVKLLAKLKPGMIQLWERKF